MKRVRISFSLNIVIVILVAIATTFMFFGIRFMPDNLLLEATRLQMFKFFTVDSNILVGIASLIMLIYEYKYIKENKSIPKNVYLFKYISTCGITLTFLVTLFFLAPQYGYYAMYNNNNLFFHLIIPLLTIISYCFFEKYDNKNIYAFLGTIPMFLYSFYYISMILIYGIKNDFYLFLQGNINNIYIVIPLIIFIMYLISLLLLIINKKTN